MRMCDYMYILILLTTMMEHSTSSCEVLNRGARGDGGDDTVALQRVLDDPECDEVTLPSNRTFAASVLWVRRSNVVINIANNSTLQGLPAEFRLQRPDCLTEPGLEFNWSHWCALLRVEADRNFTLRGSGVLQVLTLALNITLTLCSPGQLMRRGKVPHHPNPPPARRRGRQGP